MAQEKEPQGNPCLEAISQILQGSENIDNIRDSYASISGIVKASETTFQKLYNKKERMLIDYLEDRLEKMGRDLLHYQDMTSEENLDRLCDERRKELQTERVILLREFMEMTSRAQERKEISKSAHEKLVEKKQEIRRIQQENSRLKEEVEDLSSRDYRPLFATQPVVYQSPYSPKHLLKDRPLPLKKKSNPSVKCNWKILSKLSTKGSETDVAMSMLELPQVRQLMFKVLMEDRTDEN